MKLFVLYAQILSLLFSTPVVAYWRMECPGVLSEGRIDPIVTPGQVSGHSHVVLGGNGFHPNMDYGSTQRSKCTTCTIKGDLSNYWVPSLYFHAKNGTFYRVPIQGGVVYYQQRANYPGKKLRAFPEGFRMTAGNPELRMYNSTKAQEAISHHCLSYEGEEPWQEDSPLPPVNCPSGIRSQVYFPSCWDGVNLDTPNHQDHMAYPAEYNYGRCPDSHPNPLVSIFYEFFFSTDQFSDEWDSAKGDKQPFVYSDGDHTGYGLHGDFVNGWHVPTLQNGIDKKTSEDAGCANNVLCDGIFEYPDLTFGEDCKLPKLVDEDITGPMASLPGCNPVGDNPVPDPNCDSSKDIHIVTKDIYTDVTKSLRYSYLGCGTDDDQKSLQKLAADSPKMTVETCVKICKESKYLYAGLEYGSQCFCGNKLAKKAVPKPGILGSCDMVCAGNSSQKCGAGSRLSIYKSCKGKHCKNAHFYLPGAKDGKEQYMSGDGWENTTELIE